MNREALLCSALNSHNIGVEAKAVDFVLERVVALLADQDLARCSLLAQDLSLAKGLPDERELRLGLTEDACNGLTGMDTNSDLSFLAVL